MGKIVLTFRHFFIASLALLGSLFLSGCSSNETPAITLPDDVSAVTVPFLKALAKQDTAKAESLISANAVDEARDKFADAAAILKQDAALKPMSLVYKQRPFSGPDKNDVTVFYIGKKNKTWTTLEVRLFRLEGEKYEVEYWNVEQSNIMPKMLSDRARIKNYALYGSIGLVLACIALIAFIIWLVRRRNHLIAPVAPIDERPLARSYSDE
jgi:hypothetical protein